MRKATLKTKANALDVLAHPLRLKILEKLRAGPCCVCKIFPYVRAKQSNVSHQLALLKKAGVVRSERRGPWVWYRIADPRLYRIIDLAAACATGRLTKRQHIVPALSKKGK
jgi:DNA-binding transcriptional ArsR family regulator